MPATLTTNANIADLDEEAQARLELLESLPARLNGDDLQAVITLRGDGKSPRTIARRLTLDELVVRIELTRHDDGVDAGEEVARITRREWNRLASGTHVPNLPLRLLVQSAVTRRPGTTARDILRLAGIRDCTHGDRLLGERPYPKASRPSQTIRCEQAAKLARAAGRAPHEVPGL
jgi:hypothetical protein